MNRLEFIAALRRALAEQQPPVSLDIAANLVASYEQRFNDGIAAGGSEAEIASALGDPAQIAAAVNNKTPASPPEPAKVTAHIAAAERQRNPAHVVRVLVTAVGLSVFNLFMAVPALVYAALLAASYMTALAFYIAGIVITASGLSGANELVLNGPLREIAAEIDRDWKRDGGHRNQTKIAISDGAIQVLQEPAQNNSSNDSDRADASVRTDVLERAGQMAGHDIHISTGNNADSRTTQTVFGVSMVLGGILLFLISLVVTRYTLIGIKRYAQMNWSLLKGH